MAYRKKQLSPKVSKSKKKRIQLTQQQENQIKEAFDLFDPDRTSSISYHELKVIIRALGFQVKKSEVIQMAKQYDREQSGRINYEDFVEIMKRKYSQRDPIEQALKAFKLFDEDNTGRISLRNLKKIARQLGQTLTEQELGAMIDQFDKDQDGQISEQEFLSIVKPSAFY